MQVCPETAGFESNCKLRPIYSGNNLYEAMGYKRFLDRKCNNSNFQFVKCYFPVTLFIRNNIEITKYEAAKYQNELSVRISEHFRGRYDIDAWTDYSVSLECQNKKLGIILNG